MAWTNNGKRPNPRRTNGHRRNKLRAQVLAEEDLCWLCGKPVDKTLPPAHPWCGEVDEVVPVSLGGSPFDRTNCRLAHRLCNQRRGNGRQGLHRPTAPPFTTTRREPQGGIPSPHPPRSHPQA